MPEAIMPEEINKDTFVIETAAGERFLLPVAGAASCAQAVYTSGRVPAPALCSGLGRCGQCAVRFVSSAPVPSVEDEQVLSGEELEEGWRLGCRHAPASGMELQLPPPPQSRRHVHECGGQEGVCFLAVDLGTTSLHWRAFCAQGGKVFAEGDELNPQMGAGSEVMSRLAHAADAAHALQLRLLVLRRLRGIVAGVQETGCQVQELCVAGNTVMSSLLVGAPLKGLARAPYRLEFFGGEKLSLAQGLEHPGELEALPPAYVPPQVSPFVGGDVTAGLVHLRFGRLERPEPPFLLADFGTNGEFALQLDEERLLCASVALGPAIEGIGLTYGTVARPGAVIGFDLQPTGLAARQLPEENGGGSGRPSDCGITGAGYLSLLQRLRSVGALDEDGRLARAEAPGLTPLSRRLVSRVDGRGALPLDLKQGRVWLLPADVEEILKVKAACNLALSRLLQAAGLAARELRAICLAGALGRHVGVANLEGLGFLPLGSGSRVRLVGNSSLEGAALLLAPQEAAARRTWAARLAKGAEVLDLTQDEAFTDAFMKRMTFSYVP